MAERVHRASPNNRVAAGPTPAGVLLRRRNPPAAVTDAGDYRQSEGESLTAYGTNFGHDFSNIPVGGGDAGQVGPVRPPNVEAQRGGDAGAGLNPTFRPRNPGPAQTPPPAPTDDVYSCPNPNDIHAGVRAARQQVRNVAPRLAAFLNGSASPGERRIVQGALNTNFHTTAPADVTRISNNLSNLQLGLAGRLTFRCTSACQPGDLAHVFRGGRLPTGETAGDIYICPEFGTCNNQIKIPGVFIHERAHLSLGATDYAYEFEPAYGSLSPQLAMANADSYAVAIRQIFHNGAHGPGERC